MGQKFSELRGLLLTMDGEEAFGGRENGNNDFVTNGEDGKLNEIMNSGEAISPNGNNDIGDMNEHFEKIYSNSSESSTGSDEVNGNVVPQQQAQHSGQCVGADHSCTCSLKTKPKMSGMKRDDQLHTNSLKRSTLRTMSFVSGKRSRGKAVRTKDGSGNSVKKRNTWVLKFNCAKLKTGLNGSSSSFVESDIPEPNIVCDSCVCTGYRRTEEHHLGAGVVFEANSSRSESPPLAVKRESCSAVTPVKPDEFQSNIGNPVIDLSKFNPEDFPIEDCDERARLERAREIAEGVEPPPGFQPGQHIQLVCPADFNLDNLTTMLFHAHLGLHTAALTALSQIDVSLSPTVQRGVHSQADYIHCLVPDLLQITSCSFYWGKMDRYEAERLLEGRPEGTFLLRDSAQEEYLFSVSFRKYGRSLHARIEQWNHRFSFDSHDPGVFASPTVCGLIEHYKDPTCCMFFEPMLTIPLHRNFPFPLQHLCRAAVCSRTDYNSINQLHLPKVLKSYLKEYHYKQRVRVRKFDTEL